MSKVVLALPSIDCTPELGLLLIATFGSWGCSGSATTSGGEGGVAFAFDVAFAFALHALFAFDVASPFGCADDFAAVGTFFGGLFLAGADGGSAGSSLCGVPSNTILLLIGGALALFPGFPDPSEAEPGVDPNDDMDEALRMLVGVSWTLCAFKALFWGVAAAFNAAAAAKSFLFLKI